MPRYKKYAKVSATGLQNFPKLTRKPDREAPDPALGLNPTVVEAYTKSVHHMCQNVLILIASLGSVSSSTNTNRVLYRNYSKLFHRYRHGRACLPLLGPKIGRRMHVAPPLKSLYLIWSPHKLSYSLESYSWTQYAKISLKTKSSTLNTMRPWSVPCISPVLFSRASSSLCLRCDHLDVSIRDVN